MAGYFDLPRYLRRDLRRIYRPIEVIQEILPVGDLIQIVRSILAQGKTAIVDHLSWRLAAGGFGARQVEKMFTDKLQCGSEYRRRGDMLIFFSSS